MTKECLVCACCRTLYQNVNFYSVLMRWFQIFFFNSRNLFLCHKYSIKLKILTVLLIFNKFSVTNKVNWFLVIELIKTCLWFCLMVASYVLIFVCSFGSGITNKVSGHLAVRSSSFNKSRNFEWKLSTKGQKWWKSANMIRNY